MKLHWDYTDGVVFPHLYFCSNIANPFSPPGLLPPSWSWLTPLLHETLGLKGSCEERVGERGNCLLCFLLFLINLWCFLCLEIKSSHPDFLHMLAFRLQKSEIKIKKTRKIQRGKEASLSKGEELYREGIAFCVSFTGQSFFIYPGMKQTQGEKTHSQIDGELPGFCNSGLLQQTLVPGACTGTSGLVLDTEICNITLPLQGFSCFSAHTLLKDGDGSTNINPAIPELIQQI